MSIPPLNTAHEYIQAFPVESLAAAAGGEIDINELASHELACRGLDQSGKWVGFAQAEKLAKAAEERSIVDGALALAAAELMPQKLLARLECAIAAYTAACALPLHTAQTYGRGVATGAKTEIKLMAEAAGMADLAREIEKRWEMHTGDCPA